MNRFLFLFTGLCLAAACLTGCGDQPDDAAAEIPPGSVMLHDGKIVPIVDDESELTETESGYLWSFHDGDYSMTFPKEWESRFLIRGTTVYCLACFERGTSSSSLFSVEYRPAEDVGAKKPTPELILGVSGDEFLLDFGRIERARAKRGADSGASADGGADDHDRDEREEEAEERDADDGDEEVL